MSNQLKLMSLLLVFLPAIEGHANSDHQLSQIELKALESFIEQDKQEFIKGTNETMHKADFIYANAISSAYEENEVAADLKYKNKRLYVKATIKSINSGINDEPFLSLEADTPLTETRAYFKDSKQNLQTIAELRKGENINLVCIGGSEMLGSPSLKNCITTKQYANEIDMTNTHKSFFLNYYAGEENQENEDLRTADMETFALVLLVVTNLPEAQSICPSFRSKCSISEFIKLLKGCTVKGTGSCDEERKAVISKTYETISQKIKLARNKH